MATSKWWLRRNRIASPDTYSASATDAATTENVDEPSLDDLTKAELVERAEAAGLDTSGTKAELVERLGAPSDG